MINSEDDLLTKVSESACLSIESLSIDDDASAHVDNDRIENNISVPSSSQKQQLPSLFDTILEAPPGKPPSKKSGSTKNKDKPKGKSRRKDGPDDPYDYKLFVTKLSQTATCQDIKEYFERYGAITDVVMITNQTPICAFVTFSKLISISDLFTKNHSINSSAVEIRPNRQLRDECRRYMTQRS